MKNTLKHICLYASLSFQHQLKCYLLAKGANVKYNICPTIINQDLKVVAKD